MPSSDSPALTGGCGCGAVRFEISEPLVGAAYCHCTRCQRRSGTAVQASAKVEPGSLTVTRGEDQLKGWAPEGGLERVFCAECGSALLGRDPESGEISIVRMGAIDGDPGIRPQAHQFVAYAAPWEPVPEDGLPRFDERIPPS
ncbi:MAG: GFA family protein [Thermoleophilaceae bacterium]